MWQAVVGLVMDSRGDWRRKIAEATGLPFTRVRALKRIAAGPMTLRDLAESLGSDPPAATVAVNDLEERGLVTRVPHPEDRRSKLVSVTSKGRSVMKLAKQVTDHAPEAMLALPDDDIATLARVFDTLTKGQTR